MTLPWDDPLFPGLQNCGWAVALRWCHDCYAGTVDHACWLCGGETSFERPGQWVDRRANPHTNYSPAPHEQRPGTGWHETVPITYPDPEEPLVRWAS